MIVLKLASLSVLHRISFETDSWHAVAVCCRRICTQGDHLSGKPGNVRKFHSCKKNVRKLGFKVGNCRRGGILSSKLFIAKFKLVATTVFS